MIKLMRKDLILNWNILLVMLALLAGLTIYMRPSEAPLAEPFAILMLVSSMIGMMLPAREDRFKAAGFTCSLPVSRTRVVLARYLLQLLLFPFLLCFIALAHAAFRGFRFPVQVFEPGTILLLLGVYLVTVSVLFPFLIRFGFIGLMIGLVALQAAGMALLMFATSGARFSIAAAIQAAGSMLARLRAAVGANAYHAIILVALLGLYVVSFLISDAAFRRKEL